MRNRIQNTVNGSCITKMQQNFNEVQQNQLLALDKPKISLISSLTFLRGTFYHQVKMLLLFSRFHVVQLNYHLFNLNLKIKPFSFVYKDVLFINLVLITCGSGAFFSFQVWNYWAWKCCLKKTQFNKCTGTKESITVCRKHGWPFLRK